jgi:c-di-GMP-binding flagellar brake protein YcgR
MDENEKRIRVGIANVERRKHPRFRVDLPIEYHKIDSPIPQTGQRMNTSEGGLLVYLPERMEAGDHLKMRLFFSFGSDLSTIEVMAEVVWVDIHLGKDWGDYRVGVKFLGISPDDLSKLKDFLRSLSE